MLKIWSTSLPMSTQATHQVANHFSLGGGLTTDTRSLIIFSKVCVFVVLSRACVNTAPTSLPDSNYELCSRNYTRYYVIDSCFEAGNKLA